ncbi:MAG: hypothetical protein II458_01920 [Oscillospiraceae bacterium]|nr:hypothetical protein [Oscillospiraceae bacterium]
MSDYKDEIKEKAGEIAGEVKGAVGDITGDAKGTFQSVKEETTEVFQEAKAAVTGQKLDSAETEGGAGYRADNSTSSGSATAALVLGILAIIFSFIRIPLIGKIPLIGLILGVLGIVLGAKARKQSQTNMATAGFVCSIVGLVICALRIIF